MGQSVCFSSHVGKFSQNISGVTERATDIEKLSLCEKITNACRYSLNATLSLIHSFSKHRPLGLMRSMALGATTLKIMAIAAVPSIFARLRAGELAEEKGVSTNEQIDIYLIRTDAYATLAEILTKTIEVATLIFTEIGRAAGLHASILKSMSDLVTSVAGSLSIVFAIFQGCGMIVTAKNLVETHRFSVIFNKSAALHKPDEEYTLKDYSAARKLIKAKQSEESSFIGKHFDVKSEKMIDRLKVIESVAKEALASENQQKKLEGKQLLKTTMQMLSERMSSKKWSHARSLFSATVSNVGFGLTYSPCPAVGLTLCGVSCGISIGNFFYDKHKTHEFKTALGMTGK